MKTFLIIILIVSIVGMVYATNAGFHLVAMHPVEFFRKISLEPPPNFDIFREFTEYYGEGEDQNLFDKILWFGELSLEGLAFPFKAAAWLFRSYVSIISNLDILFEVAEDYPNRYEPETGIGG